MGKTAVKERSISLKQQVVLGRAIAEMYIAAQEGVSLRASDCACDAMEGASNGVKFGFNQVMEKSPYPVRA